MVKDQNRDEIENGFLRLSYDILKSPKQTSQFPKGDNYSLYLGRYIDFANPYYFYK